MNTNEKMRKIIITLSLFIVAASAAIAGIDDPNDSSRKAILIAPPAPVFTDAERQSELDQRRKKVADALANDSLLILFSADSKLYADDVDYVYRQENNLYYLTALKQNGVTFVMRKKDGKISEFIFLPKRNPQFETWNGRMYSNQEATRISGIKNVVDSRHADEFLSTLSQKKSFGVEGAIRFEDFPKTVYLITGNAREFSKEAEYAKLMAGYTLRNAAPIFAGLRLIKSPYEIKLMQHAINITGEAIGRSMGMINKANWEYEVQAEVEYTFRRRNADFWGYPSIVGCGPNATTLHYVESQGKVSKGDLMLMDVGAEYDHYTADITRTFPVNGKFTKEQAEIYQIVFDAQEAAAAQLKPGSSFGAASQAAQKVISDGLFKLGLITEKNSGQEQMWYMHGWGHWLGMNVHDVGNYGVLLREGMIMTNEPGIYIRGDALDYLPDTPESQAFISKMKPAFEKYKNIGVRIEDDMLITANGVEWMSKAIPRKIKDVESFMAKASIEMKNYARIENGFDSRSGFLNYRRGLETFSPELGR